MPKRLFFFRKERADRNFIVRHFPFCGQTVCRICICRVDDTVRCDFSDDAALRFCLYFFDIDFIFETVITVRTYGFCDFYFLVADFYGNISVRIGYDGDFYGKYIFCGIIGITVRIE